LNSTPKRLILLELNEINFDVVENYIALDAMRFPSLKKLLNCPKIRTTSEKSYDELEPWIQWTSVHTCKQFAEHSIFRLGDMVGSGIPQIFEQLEIAGYKVGAISPMNTENRLKSPSYFMPDPWTKTQSDPSWWSRMLTQVITQTVNENAKSHITAKSGLLLTLGLLRFARIEHYKKYISLIVASRHKPWLKALVLDLFLHDIHWSMFNCKMPNFSVLFLNAGAHIQHHYFFNADPIRKVSAGKNPTWYVSNDEDPIADMLDIYDMIVGQYFSRMDTEIVLATGLSQKPYDRIKFYYRLNNHAEFLQDLGIKFNNVLPRMTRDFLIEFESNNQALSAQKLLASIRVSEENIPLFGEIDNRGRSLFVTLTYPHQITKSTQYRAIDRELPLLPKVSFVAIKNGMHQEEGFAFFSAGIASKAPKNGAHVASLGKAVLEYFDIGDSLKRTLYSFSK
jgi:hypothetical protein